MSLADILAKKKAAEGSAPQTKIINPPAPTKEGAKPWPIPETKVVPIQPATIPSQEVQKTEPVTPKENKSDSTPEKTPEVTNKPLTFAEKMALKRQQQTTSESPAPQPTQSRMETSSGTAENSAQPAPIPVVAAIGAPKDQEADVATAQAYADISVRINQLEELSETALGNAMSDLKKALMANPAAVSLMLDTDYFKMVVALRKLTKEDQVEAAKEKTNGGKKSKTPKIDFTDPAAVEAAFNEL